MTRRRSLMVAGFLAAALGDWFLAVKGCPRGSSGFLCGVAAFTVAQLLWSAAHWREARPSARAFAAVALPLAAFVGARLWPVLGGVERAAISLYALVGPLNVAMAWRSRRRFYLWGAALLVASDVMIGMRWLGVPGSGGLVGPLYVAAEVALLLSAFLRHEPRRRDLVGSPALVGGATLALAGGSFVLAAAAFPGGGYDPCLRMLSALGRTELRLVAYPWCHHLFVAGMLLSAAGVVGIARRMRWATWGAALNAAGLVTIALVPENVNGNFHNAGCWLATAGGAWMLAVWFRREGGGAARWGWSAVLLAAVGALGSGVGAHALGLAPFAPWVPTAQKAVILSFAVWTFHVSLAGAHGRVKTLALFLAFLPVALALALFARPGKRVPAALEREAAALMPSPRAVQPLGTDELEGLAWLEDVTVKADARVERELWQMPPAHEYSIFATRYGIAFAGYAAAAIGGRGDASVRERVGRVLGDCVRRMLRRETWAYSQSRNYWGRKPWAPDPCRRENVMYTGHLLQLLACYELFTGDRRYHRAGGGWDFVWKDGRKVHYDVERLVDVTVEQMRKGPNGGVTCEPGLMFFACNNHPHIALAVLAHLGYGDWKGDAARWERWALAHYLDPLCGGGSLNLVHHVPSGLFWPRGQNAFDGWSLLWYEAWAPDRRRALALWRRAARQLDWPRLEAAEDKACGCGCCDPAPVPASVAATFLAAAARACDDVATAERLERIVDARHLRRENGRFHLDLDRRWRVGATAMRLIALAESRGSSFRELVKAFPPPAAAPNVPPGRTAP